MQADKQRQHAEYEAKARHQPIIPQERVEGWLASGADRPW